MKPSPRTPSPRRPRVLPLLLALGLLCLPAVAYWSSGTLNYYANFNDPTPPPPGGAKTWKAVGGSVTAEGPAQVFEVVFPTPGDGEMQIRPNTTGSDADLVCDLTVPVEGVRCDVGFSLSAVDGFSDIDVRFDDVGDSGILDLHFNDDRHVVVNGGMPVALPLLPGETAIYVNITLESSLVSGQTWELTLTGPTITKQVSGTMAVPTLSLSSIHYIRRAGEVGGTWRLDDVVVTSDNGSATDFIAEGLYTRKN